jgi:quercetin dioxygenase-like cupin family protein
LGFDQHAIGTLHHHPHTQASYVSKGKFEISIGVENWILVAAVVYLVTSGEEYGPFVKSRGS